MTEEEPKTKPHNWYDGTEGIGEKLRKEYGQVKVADLKESLDSIEPVTEEELKTIQKESVFARVLNTLETGEGGMSKKIKCLTIEPAPCRDWDREYFDVDKDLTWETALEHIESALDGLLLDQGWSGEIKINLVELSSEEYAEIFANE